LNRNASNFIRLFKGACSRCSRYASSGAPRKPGSSRRRCGKAARREVWFTLMTMGEYDPDGVQAQAESRRQFLNAIRICEVENGTPSSVRARACRALTELRGVPLQSFQLLHDCSHDGISSDLLQWNSFKRFWLESGFQQRLIGAERRFTRPPSISEHHFRPI